MRIGLIGYGKMGKEIEKVLIERGHEVRAIVDSYNELQQLVNKVDVAIEFTEPEAAWKNINWCMDNQVPVVVGTTGWYHHFDEMVKTCKAKDASVFYATNFSVGVNIVFKMNEMLAKIMEPIEGYKARIEETHHIHKKDSPSGTAITLSEGLITNNKNYAEWQEATPETANDSVLPIVAFRENEVPGIHEVVYDSAIDTIMLKHSAKSRKGFALGSVLAAEYIADKKGVFNMKDLLNFNN